VVVIETKFRCASATVSACGSTTLPKLHGLLNQPFVEAELAPAVASVGVLVSVIAPARRAGKVVTSDHVPAGSVRAWSAVETACWTVPSG